MKERPINCKAHEVRALLDGRNTQIRRVVKPQPTSDAAIGARWIDINGQHQWAWVTGEDEDIIPSEKKFTCPYGQPGDGLWVRETWSREFEGGFCYRADDAPEEVAVFVDAYGNPLKGSRWKPSIHMPREASRILLEVTGVRVERLQDISNSDAIAEGVNVHPDHRHKPRESILSPMQGYRDLWKSINGPGSWEANPWVWVIEFKRVEAA